MKFDGEFELTGVSAEKTWLVLSDPVAVKKALPGCKFLALIQDEEFNFDEYEPPQTEPETLPEADPDEVAARAFEEGQRYATVMEVGVGSVKPTVEGVVSIDQREFPKMEASGRGSSSNSTFEMKSGMTISETDDGSKVEWWAETTISGRIAQMGQRVLNPVANKVVNNFFNNIQDQLMQVEKAETKGLSDRVRDLL